MTFDKENEVTQMSDITSGPVGRGDDAPPGSGTKLETEFCTLEQAAYIAAGLGAVAYVVGAGLTAVSIEEYEGDKGASVAFLLPTSIHQHIERPDGRSVLNRRRERRAQMAQLRKVAIIDFAGNEAVSRLLITRNETRQSPPQVSFGNDEVSLDAICQVYGRFNLEWLQQRRLEAFMLVHDLWPEIKALAAALLAPKRLTGEQAVAIINPLKLTLAKYRMRKGIRITRVTQVLSKEQG